MLASLPNPVIKIVLKQIFSVTPDYIYNLISPYGIINKIKIIVIGVHEIQTLVEMNSQQSAMNVKYSIDMLGSPLIQCEYTNQKTILFFKNDDGKDYTLETRINEEKELSIKNLNFLCTPPNQRVEKKDKTHPPSEMICLSCIENDTSANLIYNVFSNFGNINQILFIKSKEFALIQYEHVEQAKFVVDNCQKIPYFDSYIKISFVSNDAIEKLCSLTSLYSQKDYFKKDATTNRQNYYIQEYFFIRFNQVNNLQLFPPSRIIHVSNLKRFCSNNEYMWDIFSEFGIVEAVKVLNSQTKFMCLIKMETLNQAITAMTKLHNQDLEGRPIQISFTKTRI